MHTLSSEDNLHKRQCTDRTEQKLDAHKDNEAFVNTKLTVGLIILLSPIVSLDHHGL